MGRAALGHEDFTAEYAKYAETGHEPQQIEDEEENEDEEDFSWFMGRLLTSSPTILRQGERTSWKEGCTVQFVNSPPWDPEPMEWQMADGT